MLDEGSASNLFRGELSCNLGAPCTESIGNVRKHGTGVKATVVFVLNAVTNATENYGGDVGLGFTEVDNDFENGVGTNESYGSAFERAVAVHVFAGSSQAIGKLGAVEVCPILIGLGFSSKNVGKEYFGTFIGEVLLDGVGSACSIVGLAIGDSNVGAFSRTFGRIGVGRIGFRNGFGNLGFSRFNGSFGRVSRVFRGFAGNSGFFRGSIFRGFFFGGSVNRGFFFGGSVSRGNFYGRFFGSVEGGFFFYFRRFGGSCGRNVGRFINGFIAACCK